MTVFVALLTALASTNVSLAVRYDDGAGHRHRATLSCRGDRARTTGYLSAAPTSSPRSSSGTPTTAASRTAGCSYRTSSISRG